MARTGRHDHHKTRVSGRAPDLVPAGSRPAGSPRTRGPCSTTWTRGITRAVLAGHSYGGVALSAAALAPRRVAAVVLLAGAGRGCVNGWDKLLAAPRDTLVPVDAARRVARALPDARLQLIDGAGHHLPGRAPDAVAAAIVAFLAAAEEQAARDGARSRTIAGRRRVKAAVVLAGPLAPAGTAGVYRGCG
jgi:hypothetical protein